MGYVFNLCDLSKSIGITSESLPDFLMKPMNVDNVMNEKTAIKKHLAGQEKTTSKSKLVYPVS